MSSAAVPFPQLVSQFEGQGLTSENCGKIALEIAKAFKLYEDEVAILRIANGSHLVFLYPEKLVQVGIIPLNNSSAVAARTALSKRPEVLNNFAQIKHASVFEAVPVASKARQQASTAKAANSIQKMMTAPVMGPHGVLGVIQVSRKGSTPQAAGPDFTPADLQRLVSMANMLAKCFK